MEKQILQATNRDMQLELSQYVPSESLKSRFASVNQALIDAGWTRDDSVIADWNTMNAQAYTLEDRTAYIYTKQDIYGYHGIYIWMESSLKKAIISAELEADDCFKMSCAPRIRLVKPEVISKTFEELGWHKVTDGIPKILLRESIVEPMFFEKNYHHAVAGEVYSDKVVKQKTDITILLGDDDFC